MKTLILTLSTIFIATPAFAAVDLGVPFSPQAPEGNWNEPWQNACEETSIMMIDEYYKSRTGTINTIGAKNRILEIFRIKNNFFGQSLDENAEEIAMMINAFFPWEATTVENPTLEQLKQELDNKRPVIIPAYGTALQNPHFRTPLLDYHVIVLSGYDDQTQEFITEDPGTQYGLDLRYPYARIMNAMHDFLPGKNNTKNGKKIVIFTSPNITDATRHLDKDNDGLTKEQEIQYGTALFMADTDTDGYTDKQETESGYSPFIAEFALPTNSVVKSKNDPKVFVLQKAFDTHKKRHIKDEQTFINSGYKWEDIITISEKYLEKLPNY